MLTNFKRRVSNAILAFINAQSIFPHLDQEHEHFASLSHLIIAKYV